MNDELKKALTDFINCFEEVFHKDWNYTKQQLGVIEETEEQKQNAIDAGLETIYLISPAGTFLNPKVDDETEDWGNRGELLRLHRKLKSLLQGV